MSVLGVGGSDLKQVLVVFVAVWTLANAVDIVDAGLTVGVLAHEVDRGKVQLSLAKIARLLVVKVDGGLLHLGYLALAVADLRHFFVQPAVVLVNALLLRLQILEKERLENAERQVLVSLQDLKNQEGRQDVSLSDLLQGEDELGLGLLLVSEVGERLDPHVAIDGLVLDEELPALAHLKHLV